MKSLTSTGISFEVKMNIVNIHAMFCLQTVTHFGAGKIQITQMRIFLRRIIRWFFVLISSNKNKSNLKNTDLSIVKLDTLKYIAI